MRDRLAWSQVLYGPAQVLSLCTGDRSSPLPGWHETVRISLPNGHLCAVLPIGYVYYFVFKIKIISSSPAHPPPITSGAPKIPAPSSLLSRVLLWPLLSQDREKTQNRPQFPKFL